MQRWIVAALILIMACSLFLGCEKKDTYEIALITDMGNIDDKAFNQGAWEGITAYAASSGKTYSYYRPYENTDAARLETIGGAVRAGAKVIDRLPRLDVRQRRGGGAEGVSEGELPAARRFRK